MNLVDIINAESFLDIVDDTLSFRIRVFPNNEKVYFVIHENLPRAEYRIMDADQKRLDVDFPGYSETQSAESF